MRLIDLAGRRFNRLLVLHRAGSRYGHALWRCGCDCGKSCDGAKSLDQVKLAAYTVCLSSGPAIDRILASAAIPAAFPSVRIDNQHLIDGAIGSNAAILTAAKLGATRIIVLPTGFACDLQEPPKGATARRRVTVKMSGADPIRSTRSFSVSLVSAPA